jgi:hypothetical protein
MSSSNSITEPSPKFQLPTRRSIMAEAKAASPAPEWLSTRNAALSNFQKVVSIHYYGKFDSFFTITAMVN